MAERLAVLAGTLALLILAVGLPPAVAQEAQYAAEYAQDGAVSATGYLTPVSPPGAYSHLLNDEATGQQYLVRGSGVDLGAYDDGQRVTVSGTLAKGEGTEPVLEVTRVEEPGDAAQPGEAATLSFELSVAGMPPAGATFFGNIQTGEGGPGIFVPLTDPDGDGTYTGTTTIPDRFPPGLRPLPPDAEPLAFPIRIVQGTGTNPGASGGLPGEPSVAVKDFGTVPMQESNLFQASISFAGGPKAVTGETTSFAEETTPVAGEQATGEEHEDGGNPEGGVDLNKDGAVDETDSEVAAQTSDAAAKTDPEEATLPNTGGLALPVLAGALLVGAGFLIRRTASR